MNLKSPYADELAALTAQVQALGGNKTLGCLIWPDKAAETAQKLMSDCCNNSRSQRLSPSQLLMVMRLGREADVHILPEYLLAHSGYERPVPVTFEDEEKALYHSMNDIVTRLERLQAQGKKRGKA